MLPKDIEGWDALSREELMALDPPANDLRLVIRDLYGLGSKCYFMNKGQSIEYILNPDQRPAILEAAEQKYKERQALNAELRTGPKLEERVLAEAEGREYRFVEATRPTNGFEDPFSGRAGKIAYIIEDVGDGTRFPVQKRTALILETAGQLSGFEPNAAYRKTKPAHEAGFQTLEDVLTKTDSKVPKDSKVLDEPVESEVATVEESEPVAVEQAEESETLPVGTTDLEAELDDILNSLPG